VEKTYWRSAAYDEAMQNEHGFQGQAMLDTSDIDLAGRRVLDVGSNQGGFLRLLVDDHGIAEGHGYDPAAGAIEDARRLAGDRPLHFEAANEVPETWSGFDVAFSHDVLNLLPDLASHARALYRSLDPGGVYFAVLASHTGSPLMVEWHAAHGDELGLPPLYNVDDVISTFQQVGFEVSIARLAYRFVPAQSDEDHDGQFMDWLGHYYDYKVLFRFARPGSV
jgi:SAM-dependent methyltransferase